MDSATEQTLKAFAKFSTPEIVRENLIRAALLITAFENLSDRITSPLLSFFASDWGPDSPFESEAYRQSVGSLHKKRFDASCLWFLQSGAIDDQDVKSLHACRHHRNDVVHQLLKYLIDPAAEVRLEVLDEIMRLHAKIERWWIKEIEVPTNPDFDGVEVQEEDIQSGTMLLLALIKDVALNPQSEGPRSDARELKRR